MKLWLLKPINGAAPPWGGHDMTYGVVVRAEDERAARQLARSQAGDEVRVDLTASANRDAWIDPALSNCVELLPEGGPGVIITNFLAG